jgi:hypothetical protein
MEMEFDKEIDAILRKARSGDGVNTPGSAHLDADAIAAFAENALPAKARLLSIEHFADCVRCRKLLSRAVHLNSDAADEIADPALFKPSIDIAVPWYQRIFRMPGLALGMGALVLVFGGILGYFVLQNQRNLSNATVSQVAEPEQRHSGSSLNGQDGGPIPTPSEVPAVSLNTNSSTAANVSANMAPMMPREEAKSAGDNAGGASGSTVSAQSAELLPKGLNFSSILKATPAARPEPRSGGFQIDGASGSENNFIIDGQEVTGTKAPAKPAVAVPPPPDTTDSTSAGAAVDLDEKKADAKLTKEDSRDKDLAKTKQNEDRGLRRNAAKRVGSLSVPLQPNQANDLSQMSITRTAGGKTFSNRNGAWYDSSYHGQATINFRRGTTEYKKLDKGLRNIADAIGGTVIVVWKEKAYRIQ